MLTNSPIGYSWNKKEKWQEKSLRLFPQFKYLSQRIGKVKRSQSVNAWHGYREVMKNYCGMSEKFEFVVDGHTTKVVENKDYWDVHFNEAPAQKIFYHVNAAKDGIWMWESGKIDEASLSIGALIEDVLVKRDARPYGQNP